MTLMLSRVFGFLFMFLPAEQCQSHVVVPNHIQHSTIYEIESSPLVLLQYDIYGD